MQKRQLLDRHRDTILALAAEHGATNVRVFGSAARGDEHAASDVDLVVKLAPGRGYLDLVDFLDGVTALLGCKVDVLTEHKLMRPRLRQNIERDAVAL